MNQFLNCGGTVFLASAELMRLAYTDLILSSNAGDNTCAKALCTGYAQTPDHRAHGYVPASPSINVRHLSVVSASPKHTIFTIERSKENNDR